MALSWPEIRARAAEFSRRWSDASDERAETQSFYNEFFAVFDVDRKRVSSYETRVDMLKGARGYIDLFWPGELIVEQKSAGRDLHGATHQVLGYTDGLSDRDMPKRTLVSDFQRFQLTDLRTNETVRFTLPELKDNVEHFAFILGRQSRTLSEQAPVSIKAAELVGTLHDEIAASGYTGHRLELFLTRIVFCLFADDTGIFEPRDIMWDLLERETKPDGSDTAGVLSTFFDTLNTPEDARSEHLPEHFARFPHVNGKLFEEYLPPPHFNASMHAALLNACRFDWTPISPAIFGSLFQSVMNPAERRARGAHYTTEENILKVIEPLFLDDLKAELAHILTLRSGRRQRLEGFQDKLASLTFFDPACGCGNFLIIAYREIRLLELEVLRALTEGQKTLDLSLLCKVDVNQFYGIEYEEFPAEIAKVALYMMDHLMNRQMSDEFGAVFRRLPLRHAPTIVHGDALEIDWEDVLPPERCSYVLGNPPFVGAKFQSPEQRAQVRAIADLGKSGGTLDYVCAWFVKAGLYAQGDTRIAFVSTNSICQGEQVAQLWPILFDRCKLEIGFAHRTFEWGSEARGKAHVHVVIIGLDRAANRRPEARLFSYPDIKGAPEETRHAALSPYLFDASGLSNPHLVVKEVSKPINSLPRMGIGSKPIDGGYLILTVEERAELLAMEPAAEQFIHPYLGAKEFLQGGARYILNLTNVSPAVIAPLSQVRQRIKRVRQFRLGEIPAKGKSPDKIKKPGMSSLQLSDTPTQYHVTVIPQAPFLLFPRVSSERREYVPVAFVQPPTIPSDSALVALDVTPEQFAVFCSAANNAWLKHIGGRLKSDVRYSAGLVYNTFPLPEADLSTLAPHAQAILEARDNHPGATLADLYDPDLMPPDLRKAHRDNDRAVDRLYRKQGFQSDRERVEHLFMLYEKMTDPLLASPKPKRRRKRGG